MAAALSERQSRDRIAARSTCSWRSLILLMLSCFSLVCTAGGNGWCRGRETRPRVITAIPMATCQETRCWCGERHTFEGSGWQVSSGAQAL